VLCGLGTKAFATGLCHTCNDSVDSEDQKKRERDLQDLSDAADDLANLNKELRYEYP
jgi:hypothetical protein